MGYTYLPCFRLSSNDVSHLFGRINVWLLFKAVDAQLSCEVELRCLRLVTTPDLLVLL